MSLLTRIGLKRKPGLLVLDARTLEPTAQLDTGGWRGRVVSRGGDVWVLSPEEHRLERFHGASGEKRTEVELDDEPYGLELDEHGLLTTLRGGHLVRMDPESLSELRHGRLPGGTDTLAAGGGALWGLRLQGDDPVRGNEVSAVQIDPDRLTPMHEVTLGSSRFAGAPEIIDGRLVIAMETAPGEMGEVVLDARSGTRRAPSNAPARLRALATDGASLWRIVDGEVRRFDRATGRTEARHKLPNELGGPATLAGDRLWLISHRSPRSGVSENRN